MYILLLTQLKARPIAFYVPIYYQYHLTILFTRPIATTNTTTVPNKNTNNIFNLVHD